MRRQHPLPHLCDISGFATALRLIFRVALAFPNAAPENQECAHPAEHPLHHYLFLDNYHHRILCIAKDV